MSDTGKRSDDVRVVGVVDVILDFDWHNYGLDELGEINPQHADYAWELARRIVNRLDGVS